MKKLIFIPLLISAGLLSSCAAPTRSEPSPSTIPSYSPVPTSSPTPPTAAPQRNYDELDPKGIGWGFVRKKAAPPEIPKAQTDVLEANNGYYIDHSGEKVLYLTFDEGYENGFTAKILDVLAEKQVSAAFFVTGPYLENQPELIQRMIDDGHIIGNHTVNHLNLPQQPVETVKKELDDLNKKSEELYNYTMRYMRPPEGEYSERVLAAASDMGYKTILWSMAYKDWDVNIQQGASYAYDCVVPYLHSGAIMLLHAVSSDNAAALGDIIDAARSAGYEFRSLDELS